MVYAPTVIVVVGSPWYRTADGTAGEEAAGFPAAVAQLAAAGGAEVQLVGKVGDDGAGDALVLALGRAGVGHAAILRDPAHATPIVAGRAPRPDAGEEAPAPAADLASEPGSNDEDVLGSETLLPAEPAERPRLLAADVALALGYLTDVGVIVVAEPVDRPLADALAAAAEFSGAAVVSIVASDGTGVVPLPAATVLQAPDADDEGAFAGLVARYSVELDRGTEPAAAFRAALGAGGWEGTAD